MAVMAHVQLSLKGMMLVSCVHGSVVCDNWLVAAVLQSDCRRVWLFIIDALEEIGFAVNRLPHKRIEPRQALQWLGQWFDSAALPVSLPEDKLCKAKVVILAVRGAKKMSSWCLSRRAGLTSTPAPQTPTNTGP